MLCASSTRPNAGSARKPLSIVLLCCLLASTGPPRAAGAGVAPALLLRGGLIVDGSGDAGYPGEVLVRDGIVVAVGAPGTLTAPDATAVDLTGLALAPGFIDIHNHSTERLFDHPEAITQVAQGVTTIVVGADGSSPWPIAAYLDRIDSTGVALNVATMVGHGTVRSAVLGEDYRRPATEAEVASMAERVERGMDEGAFGLSTGLEYDPGYYSDTDELVALARVAAAHGGFYMSHIRDEEEGLLGAIAEAIDIGRRARVPVQISHIKAGNASVWGRADDVLELLERARRHGVDVTADQYPYAAWQSGLGIVVPSRRFDDPEDVAAGIAAAGGAGRLQIVGYDADPSVNGLRLDAIAERWGLDPVRAYQRILQTGGSQVIGHTMDEGDVDTFLVSPLVMTASDGGVGSAHPRGAGAFVRVLGRYARERELVRLERAVARGSAWPAKRLGLTDRGRIRAGAIADLVAFDPGTVTDRSTFIDPLAVAAGVARTWVAGVLVWDGRATTGARPGRALRRPD